MDLVPEYRMMKCVDGKYFRTWDAAHLYMIENHGKDYHETYYSDSEPGRFCYVNEVPVLLIEGEYYELGKVAHVE